MELHIRPAAVVWDWWLLTWWALLKWNSKVDHWRALPSCSLFLCNPWWLVNPCVPNKSEGSAKRLQDGFSYTQLNKSGFRWMPVMGGVILSWNQNNFISVRKIGFSFTFRIIVFVVIFFSAISWKYFQEFFEPKSNGLNNRNGLCWIHCRLTPALQAARIASSIVFTIKRSFLSD